MRAVILSVLAAGVTMGAFTLPAAAAYDYPYCLQGRDVGFPGDCSYQTYAQCKATASGRGLGCDINPRIAFRNQNAQGRRYGQQRFRGDEGFYSRW